MTRLTKTADLHKSQQDGRLFYRLRSFCPIWFTQENRGFKTLGDSSGWAGKQGTSRVVQGMKGSRSRQAFLNLRAPLLSFFYLHSRGEDFDPVFARHSDDDRSARVPSRAIEGARAPVLATTVPSSTYRSQRLCHMTPCVVKR